MKNVCLGLLLCCSLSAFAQGPAYPYSVLNSWTPSTSQNTAGYFVYRGSASKTGCAGTFAKLFTTPLPATAKSYTDPNPAEGMYCYAATAVDGTGQESGLSNTSQANVPLPPPTGFGATVATIGNKSDVIYAWKNPTSKFGLTGNSIYCNQAPTVQVFFPTTKVRVTTPSGSKLCVVTASSSLGESGPSKSVQVNVP